MVSLSRLAVLTTLPGAISHVCVSVLDVVLTAGISSSELFADFNTVFRSLYRRSLRFPWCLDIIASSTSSVSASLNCDMSISEDASIITGSSHVPSFKIGNSKVVWFVADVSILTDLSLLCEPKGVSVVAIGPILCP